MSGVLKISHAGDTDIYLHIIISTKNVFYTFMIDGTSKQCLTFDSYKWWVPLTYTTGTDNNFNKDRADVKWFNTTSKGRIPCMNP